MGGGYRHQGVKIVKDITMGFTPKTTTYMKVFNIAESVEFIGLSDRVDLNTQAIANMATAQGTVEGTQTGDFIFDPLPAAFTHTPITLDIQSTDTSIFEINGAANTVTFKQDANYNFQNSMIVKAGASSSRLLEFRIVNVADGAVVYERSANIELGNNDVAQINMLGLLTIGRNGVPTAPVELRMEMRQAEEDYSLQTFHSLISSGVPYSAMNVQNMDEALGLEYEGLL